ncbi:MAG: hypothetical protein IT506_04135 [Aquabacterium sp.]|nr:hypothetical protein [Aquabacterium sp.]
MSGLFWEERTHPAHKSVEWYTPAWVFDELGLTFDLDPSSPHDMETAVPAATKYTIFDDGLKKPWFGRVWLNPPYGPMTGVWMARMAEHAEGVALVFSRTDASWCQKSMRKATAMLFMAGRIEFVPGKENQHKKSRCGAGTMLLAFGDECANALERMSARGVFLRVHNRA